MFLLDTNVISEVRKADRCNAGVTRWFAGVSDGDLFISVVVTGEIRQGIERLRRRDSHQAKILERWLEDIVTSYADRILPIDVTRNAPDVEGLGAPVLPRRRRLGPPGRRSPGSRHRRASGRHRTLAACTT